MESKIVLELPLGDNREIKILKVDNTHHLRISHDSDYFYTQIALEPKDWARFIEEMKKVE